MLRYFLGTKGLKDLGLPAVPPVAVAPVVVTNIVKSKLIKRTAEGRRFLEYLGDRAAREN